MPDQPKKILLVEDERPMARALELKLADAGFLVKVARDGEEALRFLAEEKFNLILLDLVMPKRDGFGVLSEMRSRGDNTQVIVMSNLSQDVDMKRVQEFGVFDYFIKSSTPLEKIVDHVKSALNLLMAKPERFL